jgi:diguanylate cyclase (GGDEF)-like protein
MKSHTDPVTQPPDFLHESTLGVAIVGLLILAPFSINHFIHERFFLGTGSLLIVLILGFNAWSITRGRYYPMLTLLGLVPAILFFLAVALREQGIIGAFWCYPAVISFYFILPERKAWIANAALLAVTLPLAWEGLEPPMAIRMAATLLAVSIFSIIFIRVITEQQKRLRAQAVTDPLTRLYNRLLLRDSLERAIQHSSRTGEAMSIVTLDLDNFKLINDTLGHDAGDTALRGIGGLLKKRLRRNDKIFRLGGEEFLALLHGTDADNAWRIAEELRSAVASLMLLPDHPITVSIGVATLMPGEDWTAWMKRSDENLYRAKYEGRNRVVN